MFSRRIIPLVQVYEGRTGPRPVVPLHNTLVKNLEEDSINCFALIVFFVFFAALMLTFGKGIHILFTEILSKQLFDMEICRV